MSADTAAKRYSGINLASPWRGLNVVPDVTLPQGERQAAMFMYSGILAGIGIAEEETGIGLSAVSRPVDFVLESPHWLRQRLAIPKKTTEQKTDSEDNAEMQEMMQLYAQWKKAA